MSAHTPGPWDHQTRVDSGGSDRPVIVGGGDLVCAVSRRNGDQQEADANARLIAHAPAMFALLAEMADHVDENMDVTESGAPNFAMRMATIFGERSTAILAAIEGGPVAAIHDALSVEQRRALVAQPARVRAAIAKARGQ